MHELRQGSVTLASVAAHRDEVARLIARTIDADGYRPEPAQLRTIRVGGKRRVVYALPLVDVIVGGAVSELIETAISPTLSPTLYSYRAGVAWWRAPQDLAAFVRRHRHVRGTVGGGLYVIRRDVDAYTDSIPVGPDSPLWPMLAAGIGGSVSFADWELLVRVVRPEIQVPGGEPIRRSAGVPTGQPISCVLFNCYLRDLDHALSAIPGGFYARYSDDMVFAHPDPAVARRAGAIIADRVASLGLALKASKSRDLYVTGAGRASAEWPEARGANSINLLGLRVGADGALGLDRAKARELVRDLRHRVEAAVASTSDEGEAGRLACAVVRRALDSQSPETAVRSAVLLRWVVTDRRQLRELDHRIAREVAGVLARDRSIRALRRFPPGLLRDRWGLPSLVERRNRVGRVGRVGRAGRTASADPDWAS